MTATLGLPSAADLLERCRFPAPGTAIACGFSGGADSTALVALAVEAGCVPTAWHINHGLHDSAAETEARAASIAADLGVEFVAIAVEIDPSSDIEARARKARYDALPDGVYVGHTADDRAETVLMNIGRGAGLAGTAARLERVHRPLIKVRRAETESYCRARGITPVDDPMNHDTRFTRVSIRESVLPAMAQTFGRDPVPLLLRHADHAAEALEVIDDQARALDPTDASALRLAPAAIAGRAVQLWIQGEVDIERGVSRASIERILEVATGSVIATEIEGGFRIARTKGRLRIEAPDPLRCAP